MLLMDVINFAKQLKIKREEMYALVFKYGLTNEEVITKSQEIDEMVIWYQK